MVEVHVDVDRITRTAGVFGQGTADRIFAGGIGVFVEGAEAAAHPGWIEDIGGVAARADGDVKIALGILFARGTDGIIVENAKAPLVGFNVNGIQPGLIHHYGIRATRTGG